LQNHIECARRVRDWLFDFLLVRLLIVLLFTLVMMPIMLLSASASIMVCLGGWIRLGCDALMGCMLGDA
jgi:hypothetical protein